MAYDKAVDSAVLDAGLTKIANAIRAKGGTTGNMEFPDGFAALIDAIEAGGGELFHTTITPAASGEVITVELSDTPRDIRAVLVASAFGQPALTGALKYPVFNLGFVFSNPTISGTNQQLNIGLSFVYYRNGFSLELNTINKAMYYDSVPDGVNRGGVATVWHGTTRENIKPTLKLFTSTSDDNKYGVVVGRTYDVWVIL